MSTKMLLHRRCISLYLVIIIFFTHLTHAAFSGNLKSCWKRNCIFRNDAGTICLEADDNGSRLSQCTDPILSALIKTHTTSNIGRSISYYDQDGQSLGAAMWLVPAPQTFPVFVCMTGQRLDDPSIDRTICRPALRDDDMEDTAAHANECVVERPSKPYTDRCHRAKIAEKSKVFFERPVAAGQFWALGGLVILGTIYGVLVKWGATAGTRLAARRRPGVVAAHQSTPQMPVPQPHVPF